MILRPPRSTRTDTLFPYTTLFRSVSAAAPTTRILPGVLIVSDPVAPRLELAPPPVMVKSSTMTSGAALLPRLAIGTKRAPGAEATKEPSSDARCGATTRSEERRVGKEGVSKGRDRGSPDQ